MFFTLNLVPSSSSSKTSPEILTIISRKFLALSSILVIFSCKEETVSSWSASYAWRYSYQTLSHDKTYQRRIFNWLQWCREIKKDKLNIFKCQTFASFSFNNFSSFCKALCSCLHQLYAPKKENVSFPRVAQSGPFMWEFDKMWGTGSPWIMWLFYIRLL